MSDLFEDSDVNPNDEFDEDDYFNDNNQEYSIASAFPKSQPPNDAVLRKLEYLIINKTKGETCK